jgi:hypothetical protein
MLAVRRALREDYLIDEAPRLNGIFGVTGTTFAVVLAFVVLSTFQSYQRAQGGAEAEAVAVLELTRTTHFLPRSVQAGLQGQLVCYARAVVNYEWPAMRDGHPSSVVDDRVVALTDAIGEADLRTPSQTSAFGQLLDQQRDRAEGRRERLAESTAVVPGPMWFILLLGGGIVIGFVLLYADRRVRPFVMALAIANVAAIVSAGLLLVWFLDHPYGDMQGGIKPQEMRRSISIIQREEPHVAPPCDSRGLSPRPA